MRGHLEPLAAVIRVGGAYGEPYTWAATVRYFSPTAVEIMGIVRAPTRAEWRTVIQVLKTCGIRTVTLLRIKHGQKRTRTFTTRVEGTA